MSISSQTMRRLPVYLDYLKQLPRDTARISATAIASALELGDVQVRKDLASVSGAGKPRTGYDTAGLIQTLEACLGCGEKRQAVIVGAGKLGRALLDYQGFETYGLSIEAAFDQSPDAVGVTDAGKRILPMAALEAFVQTHPIRIGILTVPADQAQQVCSRMCDCGIRAIWSFAPRRLHVPEGVLVQYENMAASLAVLSSHLAG